MARKKKTSKKKTQRDIIDDSLVGKVLKSFKGRGILEMVFPQHATKIRELRRSKKKPHVSQGLLMAQRRARKQLLGKCDSKVAFLLRLLDKAVDKARAAVAAGDLKRTKAATWAANYAIRELTRLQRLSLIEEGKKTIKGRKLGAERTRQKFALTPKEQKDLQAAVNAYCNGRHWYEHACRLVADDRKAADKSPASKSWVKKNTRNPRAK